MGVPELIGRHSRLPHGPVGRVVARMMARTTSASIPWTLDLLGLDATHRVADLGFGRGDSLAALLDRVPDGHVAGIEMSETMLRVARRRFASSVRDGHLGLHHTVDGRTGPVGEGSFDRAVTLNTIYITEHPATLFGDLHALLVPGGRVAVTFPERSGFSQFPPAKTEGFFLHELADLEQAMVDAGFGDVTVHRAPDLALHPLSLVGTRRA